MRPAGRHEDQLPTAGQDHPADRPLPAVAQALGQHRVGMVGGRTIGQEVERAAGVEHRIHLAGVEALSRIACASGSARPARPTCW